MDEDESFVRQPYGSCCCTRHPNAYPIQFSAYNLEMEIEAIAADLEDKGVN